MLPCTARAWAPTHRVPCCRTAWQGAAARVATGQRVVVVRPAVRIDELHALLFEKLSHLRAGAQVSLATRRRRARSFIRYRRIEILTRAFVRIAYAMTLHHVIVRQPPDAAGVPRRTTHFCLLFDDQRLFSCLLARKRRAH